MFCNRCGAALSSDAKFCDKCGAALPVQSRVRPSPDEMPAVTAVTPRQSIPPGKSRSKLMWVVIVILALVVIRIVSIGSRESKVGTSQPATPGSSALSPAAPAMAPAVPPPKYRLFRFATNLPAAYVVPVSTSDEELKSLLWLFRSNVRAGDFKKIGITKPTAEQWGQLEYRSGMLLIYRGAKCANEEFISDAEIEKESSVPAGTVSTMMRPISGESTATP